MRFCFLLCLPFFSISQTPIDNALEYWIQFQSDNNKTEEFSLALEDYIKNKLTINSATKDELSNFPLFRSNHVNSILQYIRRNENILSWIELEQLPYFTNEYIDIIKPFLSLSIKIYKRKPSCSIIYRSKLQLEKPYGYKSENDETKILGSRIYQYLKFNSKWKNNEISLVLEKDSGEPFFRRGNLFKIGFQKDFNVILKQLNIGAYSLSLGEGLVHSNGFYLGGNNVSNRILKINKSSSETNFQLGSCFIFEKYRYKSIIGFAFNPRSANLNNNVATSFIEDGIFFSKNRIDINNSSWDANIIVSNQFNFDKLTLAYNFKKSNLLHRFSPIPKYYNKNYNLPKSFINNSISYNYFNSSFSARGEIAISNNKGWATTHFMSATLAENMVINFNYRNFSEDYKSLYTNTFKNNSRIQNENGFYTEVKYNTFNLSIISRFNYYKNNSPRYLLHLPALGKSYDQLIRMKLSDSLSFEIKYQYKISPTEQSEKTLDYIVDKKKHKFYAKANLIQGENWIFTSRIGFNHVKIKESNCGSMFAQDFTYKKRNQKITIRVAIINAATWNNRFYIYENDMLHNFSVPVYYDKSTRFYINYTYKLSKRWQLWIKYEMSQFENKNSIGSGQNEIEGNTKSVFKWQIRFNF